MSLAKKFRWFPFVPSYGVCGGADRSCVLADMDPMDKIFYDHDNELYEANKIEDEKKREDAIDQADEKLRNRLLNLKKEDMKKIPLWVWRKPFFKRAYAHVFRKAAIQAFK